MMGVLQRYLLIVIACMAMLVGIQVPNLVDQYTKRVDAHLREVQANLKPYVEIAKGYTNGSLEQLVQMHARSDNKAFQEEGKALSLMIQRKLRFEEDMAAMQGSLAARIYRFVLKGDRELIDETFQQYTYAVPLNEDALVVGAASVLIMVVLGELLLALARRLSETMSYRFSRR